MDENLIEILEHQAPFLAAMAHELSQVREMHPPLKSLHEGWAVIYEEVDELWGLVRLKAEERKPAAVERELVQIATMAWRLALDLGLETILVQRQENDLARRRVQRR